MSICVSLGGSTESVIACLEKMNPQTEMAEIRVDLLSDPENLARCFAKANQLQIQTIATVRDVQGFTANRQRLMSECLCAQPTFADIEVEAPEIYRTALVKEAKSKGVKIIISHHNYAVEEASSENLSQVVEECFAKDADIAKVAVAVCSTQGAARVLALYADCVDPSKVVSIGMGDLGKVTRVSCLALGSPFSFAAWDASSATAPGQLTREEMQLGVQLLSSSVLKTKKLRQE